MNEIQSSRMQYDVAKGFYYDGINNVKADLENIKSNFIRLSYHLTEIHNYKWYRFIYLDFDKFCKEEFNFSKSTVYRLLQINEKFCSPDAPELLPEYRDFTKSQLVEMVSMSDDDLQYVKPDMTIKQIRELKSYDSKESKIVSSAPDQVPGETKNNEESEIVEGEYKEVATSQQDNVSVVYFDDLKKALSNMATKIIDNPDFGERYQAGYKKAISDISRTLNILKRTM